MAMLLLVEDEEEEDEEDEDEEEDEEEVSKWLPATLPDTGGEIDRAAITSI